MLETSSQTQTHSPKAPSPSFHPIIEKLLDKRFSSVEEKQEFFSSNLNNLPELTQLLDLDLAAKRIREAIDKDQNIAIYGDYDVDGTTSSALFYRFFQMLGKIVTVYQPSRFKEGYGLHKSSIDQALQDKIDLLITVDCGITNVEAASYSAEKGIDLIITDHHKDGAPTQPQACALVNPNRRDESCAPELKALSGVGVAFAVCLEVKKQLEKEGQKTPSLYPLLQLVAIGTLADMVPLNFMNIKLVRHGLKQLTSSQYPGILTFFSKDERSFAPSSEKVHFNIGPYINSKGRLEHPELALKLLTCDDSSEAYHYYDQLNSCNIERKTIQKEVYDQAFKAVIDTIYDDELFINVIYAPDWHEGVIGIVASRLVETFKVPAIVFTNSEQEGVIKGSARTAGEVNVYELLKNNEDLFLKFGGHKAAAGLSLKKENLPELQARLKNQLQQTPANLRRVLLAPDLEINFSDIDVSLIKQLEKLEPFGSLNEKPLFKINGALLSQFNWMKDIHVKWHFTSAKDPRKKVQGVSFHYTGKWEALHPDEILSRCQQGEQCSLYATLGINRFRGNEYLQIMVNDIVF